MSCTFRSLMYQSLRCVHHREMCVTDMKCVHRANIKYESSMKVVTVVIVLIIQFDFVSSKLSIIPSGYGWARLADCNRQQTSFQAAPCSLDTLRCRVGSEHRNLSLVFAGCASCGGPLPEFLFCRGPLQCL